MTADNRFFYAGLATLLFLFFLLSLAWDKGWLLFGLSFLLAGLFLVSFRLPRPAFIGLVILRTAADFLTGAEIFRFGSLSVNFTSLAGVVAITFAAVVVVRGRLWQEKIPLALSWLLFLGLAAALIAPSLNPAASLVETLRWTSFFALFVLGYSLFRSGSQTTTLIKSLIFSALIPTLAAYWQLLSGHQFFDGERWRLSGTFVHPNMLAFYLLLVITLVIFLFLTIRKEAIEKYFYLLAAFPFLAVLLLTYTRGAWAALFLLLVIIGLTRYRLFLLSVLAATVLLYWLLPPFHIRVNTLLSFSVTDSTVWRIDLWRDAWDYSQDRLLSGHGPGTAPLVIGRYRSPVLGSTEPHNDYVKLILETGLLGLTAYFLLIGNLFRRLWSGYRAERWPRRRLLFLFMLIFSFVLYLSSIGDNILKDSSLQWSFWALVGSLMYSYSRLKRDEADMAI